MWFEYEITPNNAVSYRKEELTDLSQMKRQAAQIKDDIRKLGNVNVNAIEDYKETSGASHVPVRRSMRIWSRRRKRWKIIAELDEGMRKQFTEKVCRIQKEFDKVLRNFSEAEREHWNWMEADILEAGIRIISQPPGKKLQNMMQLSGGEKH